MSTLFKKINVANDFALCHFKRDVPCFQFSGFSAEDKADEKQLRYLLKAVVNLADFADQTTKGLSDHYPAQHGLKPLPVLKRGGLVRVPIEPNNLQTHITIAHDHVAVPFLWFNEGITQEKWGRFEAALRETIRLISVR